MTLGQFLAQEDRHEPRWESGGSQPIAMDGGTLERPTSQSNLLSALANQPRGKPCRAHGSHPKIEVAGLMKLTTRREAPGLTPL